LFEAPHHKERIAYYIPYAKSLNVKRINFPVETKQIPLSNVSIPK